MRKSKKAKSGLGYCWGPRKKFLDVYWKGLDNCGWEWGSDDCYEKPLVAIQLFGLSLLWIDATIISVLGFWVGR